MNIKISRATINDAAVLEALSKKTFYDTFTGTCTDEDMQDFLQEYFNASIIAKELTDENDLYFLAMVDEVPAGYIRMMEDYSNFEMMLKWKALELKRIYVDKDFHGSGLAQLMMHFIEDFAKENKYEVVWLGVWEHNLRAKNFYEKCGFTDSGFTHNFPIGKTPQTDNWLWKFLK